MFRLNLFIPFLIAMVVMVIITVLSATYIQENAIHTIKKDVASHFTDFLKKNVEKEASHLNEYIQMIEKREDIRTAFEQHDKQRLYEAIKTEYQSLNRNIELTHMYFIDTDGRVLLRVHDFGRDQDIVERATFQKAQEAKSLVYGMEFGVKHNFTLRVVVPWFYEGKLIGYIELGKEIDKIINEYTAMLGTNVYVAINKEYYQNAHVEMEEKLNPNNFYGNYYIAYSTYPIPVQFSSILDGSIDHSDITFHQNDYYITKMKLTDFSGQDLGYFVFLQNVTNEHKIVSNSALILTSILLLMAFLFFVIAYILIRKKEKNIYNLTSELNLQKDELRTFNAKLQNLFDLQKSLVILTDGKKLLMGNRAMFDFFGFEDITDFLKHYNCICERFIEDDNFFHLGKVPENETWVETMKYLPQELRTVIIDDKNHKAHIFNGSVNEFEEGNFIVTFTDISNTMKEQIKLLNKVIHDPLTGAYNREFLSNNFHIILKENTNHELGLIMCDIDHFKQVNDTFGHNFGDKVLQKFVQIIQNSIRSDDYLIRWGGEEFIIVLTIDSIDSLRKIADHIRQNISVFDFEEAGQITSSFGITLYIQNENIIDTIERADTAMYIAKHEGRNRVRSI